MSIAALLCFTVSTSLDPGTQSRLLQIAHEAVEREVKGDAPQNFPQGLPAKPVFVTIERNGKVLGCRGDLSARSVTLEQEVATEARAASFHDPRYQPLTPVDLSKTLVTVTVVEGMDPITDIEALTPSDGLVLEARGRTGVVLPWEGKDPKTRLKWAYRKAGVPITSSVSLYRLRAERFRG
jgi:AMMECR1 domain-containing protein